MVWEDDFRKYVKKLEKIHFLSLIEKKISFNVFFVLLKKAKIILMKGKCMNLLQEIF